MRADDNGVCVHGGKPRKKYIVERDSETSEVLDVHPFDDESDNSEVFTLVRLYHRHKSIPEFQRRISYIIDSDGKIILYAVVQYLFEGGCEVPVTLPPHGNAKKTVTSYHRTQKSTLLQMKEMSGKPKVIVSKIHDEAGGIIGASSSSELRRNRRQVYNSQHGERLELNFSTGKVDPIFELIQQCKSNLLPCGKKFIRSVQFDSNPCCVLASESQLKMWSGSVQIR